MLNRDKNQPPKKEAPEPKATKLDLTSWLGDVLRQSLGKVYTTISDANANDKGLELQPSSGPFKSKEILDAIASLKSKRDDSPDLSEVKNTLSDTFAKLARGQQPQKEEKAQPEYHEHGGIVGQENFFKKRGTDDTPAMLTKDEFVVNADSSKANRNILEVINNAKGPVSPQILTDPGSQIDQLSKPQHKADGGPIYKSQGGPVYLAKGGFSGAMGDLVSARRAAAQGPVGLLTAIMEKVDEMKAAWGEAVVEVGKGATSQRIGEVVSSPFKAINKVTDAAGFGADLHPVAIIAKFAGGLAESVEKLRNWNSSLHEANMKFANFSGAMAAVGARQQVRDIRLEQERGTRRSTGAEYVASTKHELEKAVTPWEDVLSTLQAGIAGKINEGLTAWFAPYKPTAEKFNEWLIENLGLPKDSDQPVSAWLRDFSKAAEERLAKNRPPHLNP